MDDRDAVNDIDADADDDDGEDLFGAELLEEYVPWHFCPPCLILRSLQRLCSK